jgi:hypothetical protein
MAEGKINACIKAKTLIYNTKDNKESMSKMETLITIIKELIEKRFYGELLIKMEAGKIVVVKKTESIKV